MRKTHVGRDASAGHASGNLAKSGGKAQKSGEGGLIATTQRGLGSDGEFAFFVGVAFCAIVLIEPLRNWLVESLRRAVFGALAPPREFCSRGHAPTNQLFRARRLDRSIAETDRADRWPRH
jgi:hypothetical protein